MTPVAMSAISSTPNVTATSVNSSGSTGGASVALGDGDEAETSFADVLGEGPPTARS